MTARPPALYHERGGRAKLLFEQCRNQREMIRQPEARQALGAPDVADDLGRVIDRIMPAARFHAGQHVFDEVGGVAVRVAGGNQHALFVFGEVPQARQGLTAHFCQQVDEQSLLLICLRDVNAVEVNPAGEFVHCADAFQAVVVLVNQFRVALPHEDNAFRQIEGIRRRQPLPKGIERDGGVFGGRVAVGVEPGDGLCARQREEVRLAMNLQR